MMTAARQDTLKGRALVTSVTAPREGVRPTSKALAWAWYGLFVLILTSIIGNVNKSLIFLVAEPIKQSLKLSDAQLGTLTGLALTLTTALATIPMGWLADRMDRRALLAVCVIIWSAATVGFGFSQTYPAMLLFAMGVAVGEAVLGPITYAMIPDIFPRDRWIVANFVFYVAVLLGFYAGMGLGGSLLGYVGANASSLPAMFAGLEAWRTTIVISVMFGPVLAVMILLMNVRKSRSAEAPVPTESGNVLLFFRQHARTLAGVFFGFGLSYAAFGAQAAWSPPILQRLFGENPAQIGQTLSLGGGGGALAGVAIAYASVRAARPRFGDQAPLVVAQWGLLIGLVISLGIPFVQTANQFYAVVFAKITFTTVAMSLSPALLQTIAPANMRGRVIAIGGMVTVIFGSLMPTVIGLISDMMPGDPRGILWAMSGVVIPVLIAGVGFLRWGAATIPDTIRLVSEEGDE